MTQQIKMEDMKNKIIKLFIKACFLTLIVFSLLAILEYKGLINFKIFRP